MQPGRSCPLDYRYSPEALGASQPLDCEAVYVIGGLYGNAQALDAILRRAQSEREHVTLVFNGDFHWFDVDGATFRRINDTVLRHVALRGNVETELYAGESEAGCGCGYPHWVGDAEVARSNAIMALLRQTAEAELDVLSALRALPMYRIVRVGGARIGIVHGDAESLAGWAYAQEHLGDDAALRTVRSHFERAKLDVIASSHTCLPVLIDPCRSAGQHALINNGAAGMPNFRGTRHGVITRIARAPAQDALYGARLGPLHVDALPVHYDHDAWVRAFLASWPPGSPAHDSYHDRIMHGPRYELAAAIRWDGAMSAVT